MKELEMKLKELEKRKEFIEGLQEKVKKQIKAKKILDEDYFEEEQTYNSNKAHYLDTLRKIEIINDAMNILEGVGI